MNISEQILPPFFVCVSYSGFIQTLLSPFLHQLLCLHLFLGEFASAIPSLLAFFVHTGLTLLAWLPLPAFFCQYFPRSLDWSSIQILSLKLSRIDSVRLFPNCPSIMAILKAETGFLFINYLLYLHLFSPCLKNYLSLHIPARILRHAQIDGEAEEQGQDAGRGWRKGSSVRVVPQKQSG